MGEEPAADVPGLAFVPVELLRPIAARPPVRTVEPAADPPLPPIAKAEEGWGDRTSLFGDLEA